jgi:REP element-mobilizing transposase RayT
MAYPVRHFDPQTIYFISSRTLQSRLLMVPRKKTNELIGGILARAVRQCEVELFAYVFMSNHFHAMVRAPSAIAMSEFMQRLQSTIAVKVGRLVRWRGRFFARRYSAEPIVDEGAQVERLRYILRHGVKEGLVAKVKEWPGLSCFHALLDEGRASPQRWRNWTRRGKLELNEGIKIGRFSDDCPSESESLTLTPLPCWKELTAQQRSRLVEEFVAEIDSSAPSKSRGGAKRVLAQDPHGCPTHTKHTPRPLVHASSRALWVEAVERYRAVVDAYRRAAHRWLAGVLEVEFPPHCMRPPPWRVPIIIV